MIKSIIDCQTCDNKLIPIFYFDKKLKVYAVRLYCDNCHFSTYPHHMGNATFSVDYPGDRQPETVGIKINGIPALNIGKYYEETEG